MAENDDLIEAAAKSPKGLMALLEEGSSGRADLTDMFLSDLLCRVMKSFPLATLKNRIPIFVESMAEKRGHQSVFNILSRTEVSLGFRRPSLALYDHALHTIGGAQKYGCTLAHALRSSFDITLIGNKPVTLDSLQKWYDLDLSGCRIKIVRIPFFEEGREGGLIDPGIVDLKKDNPFHVISRESGSYDFFVNNSMLEMVYPLANISILICHFPERGRSRFFYVDRYTEIVFNSLYTAKWIEARWGLEPHRHIYPPVDMDCPELIGKENIILSVSRFDPGGNKQQIDMIRAFEKILKRYPEKTQGWRLVLAGGSVVDNPYLDKVKRIIGQFPPGLIAAAVNVSADDLKSIYARAKIFWHLTGLGQSDPAKVEHFGMTIAEAMQCGCVPIVFKGGGQTEIVEDHVSGFVFEDVDQLIQRTLDLVENDDLLARLSRAALERGASFRQSRFITEVQEYFSGLLESYRLES